MPFITIALAIAELVPRVLNLFKKFPANEHKGLAEKVVKIAKDITGTNEKLLLNSLNANPQMVEQLNKRIMDLEKDLIRYKDQQLARERDMALMGYGKQNWRADLMVMLAVVGLFGCVGVLILCKGELPGEIMGIVSTIAGIFGSCLKDVYSFEFGSSRSSKEKDEVTASLLNKLK